MLRDYYEVLGVARDADEDAIERAYRELTKEHHPARNPDNKEAEARFREVQEAYRVLSEEAKRTEYDQALVALAALEPIDTSGQGAPTDAGHFEETLSERERPGERSPHGRVMKCETAQDWLLQCESLQPKSWPRGVVKHLRVCAGCYQFAKSIKRLEKTWRRLPIPEECETAKANFLAKLDEIREPQERKPKRERRTKLPEPRRTAWGMRWLAVAAACFVGIIGVGWLLPSRNTNPNIPIVENKTPDDDASGDVLDRLVEWNVALVNAKPEERKQLYDDYEPSFRTDLKKAVLAPDDLKLAESLLDGGRKLASANSPLSEAEAVTAMADVLFSQARGAAGKGNDKVSERCGMRYGKFNAYAVKPMWTRLSQSGPDKKGFEKDKDKLPKMLFDQEKFDQLQKQSPQFLNPELHNKFDMWSKKGGMPGFGFKGRR